MTMLSRATLALIAFALPAVTPPAEAQATRSDSAAILDAGRQFSAAYMQGDVAALTGLNREPGGWRMQLDMWNSVPSPARSRSL